MEVVEFYYDYQHGIYVPNYVPTGYSQNIWKTDEGFLHDQTFSVLVHWGRTGLTYYYFLSCTHESVWVLYLTCKSGPDDFHSDADYGAWLALCSSFGNVLIFSSVKAWVVATFIKVVKVGVF